MHWIDFKKKREKNNPCPQQPVWSTDLHSETSAPYLLRSPPHSPSPPTSVSGVGWDTDFRHFSQEVSKFCWRLSLHAYPVWASSTEHSCQMGSSLAQFALTGVAAASPVSAGFAYAAPPSISLSLFSHCFKSIRLQGIVFPAHCLINATKCLKCLKLLCMKENMGLSEKGRIKSPYSEL